MLVKNKKLAVKTTHKSDKGRKIFQPNLISWSKRYLGTTAFTMEIKIKRLSILNIIQNAPGRIFIG